MPNWKEILEELQSMPGACDILRRKYLGELHKKTGRNVIAYYSGWQQKEDIVRRGFRGFELNDSDQNGFMAAIHKLDRSIGLDLILHTPGGSIGATEHLVSYLRQMFGINIRAVIPHIAMSAGTMIALACKEIIMGKHSSIGPIDPQVYGIPAHGVIEEFERAKIEIKNDKSVIPLWQSIFENYHPSLIGECEKAIKWTNEIVKVWLEDGMFKGDRDSAIKAANIVMQLGNHELTKAHDRHINIVNALKLYLKIFPLEQDDVLQDIVMTVHHSYIHTLSYTAGYKIIENHNGVAYIQSLSGN